MSAAAAAAFALIGKVIETVSDILDHNADNEAAALAEMDRLGMALEAEQVRRRAARDARRAKVDAELAEPGERKLHEDDTVRLGPNPVPLVDPAGNE